MASSFSVETIDSPEFIDIHPYNPFISECQIKVLYLGLNRNASYIDKDAAIKIANSLPMSPIVGAYSADKGDFKGHEQRIVVEDGELKFTSDTRPYGFVAPDARAWFQKFSEFDEEGNPVEREYLMTTGYLWTGQYEEARQIVECGKGQSMELDSATTDGEWAKDNNSGMEFFIINDAVITKLCVLGDDVEPCFEGASVTGKPSEFSKQELDFRHALFTMVRELNDALGEKEGGSNMPNEQVELENVDAAEEAVEQEVEPEQPEVAEEVAEDVVEDAAEPEPVVEPEVESVAEPEPEPEDVSEFSKKKDEAPSDEGAEDKQDDNADDAKAEDVKAKDAPQDDKSGDQGDKPGDSQEPEKEDDKKKPSSNHSLLDEKAILSELAELREFKHRVESAEKDKVINKYHMLSDEDKADIVAHKDEYSLEQIDEKLALVYVNKNVDFSTVDGAPAAKPAEKKSLLAFSLDDVDFGDAEPIDEVQEALRSL